MKFKKALSGVLALSMFIPSFNINSVANTDVSDRYQTLEGEYITIDKSTEGKLHEIEIFGDTVQDENNLEDIQSVGDLYVDENGNPILDSQGREQYKLDIISSNYTHIRDDFSNVVGNNKAIVDSLNKSIKLSDNRTQWYDSYFEIILDRPVKNGDIIDFSFHSDKPVSVSVGGFISGGWHNTKTFVDVSEFRYNTVVTSEFSTIRIQINNPMNEEIVITQSSDNLSKTTILIPAQLQKIGDVADKLYWDSNKGRYIIEKNIYKGALNGVEDKIIENTSQEFTYTKYFGSDKYSTIMHNSHPLKGIISTFSKQKSIWDNDIEGIEDNGGGTYSIRLRVYKDKLSNGITNYLQNNPIDIYFVLKTPEIIETNIKSKLIIPTYDDKTHIYVETENGVNPTLKVTVDKMNRIAQDAIIEVESEPTSENLSLARHIVNQMEESIYKDRLQQRLNDIVNLDDMQLEKKTVTSSLDLYVKSENSLSLSLSTNSIMFDDFSGVQDLERTNVVELTIDSSLPYEVGAYLESEMKNSDKTVVLNKDIFNIKASSESGYNTFSDGDTKLKLLDNQQANNNVVHGIDIMLKGGIAHQKDVYKGTIKFEVVQK